MKILQGSSDGTRFFWGDQTMDMYGNFDLFPLGIVVIKYLGW